MLKQVAKTQLFTRAALYILIGCALLACAFPSIVMSLLSNPTRTPTITLTATITRTSTPSQTASQTALPPPSSTGELPPLEPPTVTNTPRPPAATSTFINSPTYNAPLTAPILLAPKNYSYKLQPFYEWTPVTNATIYILWVWMLDSNGDRYAQVIFEKYLTGDVCYLPGTTNKCMVRPDMRLIEGRMYEWFMQAYGNPGYSDLSLVQSFKAAIITYTPGPTSTPTRTYTPTPITPTPIPPIIATPISPVTVIPCGFALSLALDGSVVFIGCDKSLIRHPKPGFSQSPTSLPITTNNRINDLAISGNKAYAAIGNEGIVYIDIEQMEVIQKITAGAFIEDVISINMQDQIIYSGTYDGFLYLFKINSSPPPYLEEKKYYKELGAHNGIALDNNYLYIASSSKGLLVYDKYYLSIPEKELSKCTTLGEAKDVALYGTSPKYAFIADGNKGIFIADVTNASECKKVTSFYLEGKIARRLAIYGNYLYVALQDIGLLVLDITDPANPKPYLKDYIVGKGFDVAVDENYIYLAALEKGVYIYSRTPP